MGGLSGRDSEATRASETQLQAVLVDATDDLRPDALRDAVASVLGDGQALIEKPSRGSGNET